MPSLTPEGPSTGLRAGSAQKDPNAVRPPDEAWLKPVYRFFDALASRPSFLIGLLVAVAVAVLATVLYLNKQDARNTASSSALFQAEKAQEEESKAIASAKKPAAPESAKNGKVAAPKADAEDAVEFEKVDVETKYAQSIQKLKAVVDQYPGTRAAFEARMSLGSLFYNHGEPAKAAPWYEQAAQGAPKSYDRAISLSSYGYALENSGKYQDALTAYQKALGIGESSLKGDLLLSVARSYELLKDNAKAKSTYEQVISQLPNTEQAKTAELLKSQLPAT
jgi:TolA-binding protein